MFSSSGKVFSGFVSIFSSFGKLFSCFGKSKTSGGKYESYKSKSLLPDDRKKALLFILMDMFGRLHHAAHTATHAAAHWRHSWFVFFFFNQHAFGSQEHTCN